jgi:hypothetical protein
MLYPAELRGLFDFANLAHLKMGCHFVLLEPSILGSPAIR